MPSEAIPVERSIVLASFENRHAAEHMLASLGRGFREKARKGKVAAYVISGNKDGSLKLTQSRVLSASGISAALIRVSLAISVGFLGLFSMFRGAQSGDHALRAREGRVGRDDERAKEILATGGDKGSVVPVSCEDGETRQVVAARAAERAIQVWDGSREEFLGDLDPGSKHDWIRSALGEPTSTEG